MSVILASANPSMQSPEPSFAFEANLLTAAQPHETHFSHATHILPSCLIDHVDFVKGWLIACVGEA